VSLGVADFVAGVKARQLQVLPVIVWAQFAGLGALAVGVIAVGGRPPGSGQFWLLAAVAGLAQLAGVAAFWRSLEVGAMGVVAPISATSAIMPVAVGLSSGERPHPIQLAGIALAVAGVMLASFEPQAARQVGRRRIAAGAGLAALAAVALGVFPIAINGAADHGTALWAVFVGRACSCALIAGPAIAIRDRMPAARADRRALAAVGVLEVVGLFLVAAATREGLLTLVGVLSALYPLTTVVLARVVLKERLHWIQRAGAVVAMVGVVGITAASGS
jgi:drug/metabolite transporter (DMT)-like permease